MDRNSSEPLFRNTGYCPICMKDSVFVAGHEWLRDFYLCENCGTCPRQRATVDVLSMFRPNWRDLDIHESSPCIWFFRDQCRGYSYSHLLEEVPKGEETDGTRCEDLEDLTFPDNSFDVFLTQDVMEHVFNPDQVCREIIRVLRPNGLYIFTAPKHKDLLQSRRRASNDGGRIQHLLPPEYHGNPVGDGRSLVTWDYGADFVDLLAQWSGYIASDIVMRNRQRGIDGEFLDVFCITKDPVNEAQKPRAARDKTPRGPDSQS